MKFALNVQKNAEFGGVEAIVQFDPSRLFELKFNSNVIGTKRK